MKDRERLVERARAILATLLRRFRPDEQPGDPYARVRQPLKTGPKGRSGAIALEEPR
ncbi:MAG: hypothetical protein SFV54_28715 [Bryobacteraceae bacterium]|nr:hypothetical protein [Bryobacteraceae bacterium]